MPFVKITTSQALDAHQREELRQAVWGAIILIPQKFPETTMIQIEDKADITKGPGGEPALFCETWLYTRPAFELKKAYIEKISAAFAEITGVKPEKMYTTILEIDEWGSGGGYKHF